MKAKVDINGVVERALQGIPATIDEAMALSESYSIDELCDAADKVRQCWCGDDIDTCSIVNARSGRCSEDCKWCAQSAHHSTGVEEYDILPEEMVVRAALANDNHGVRRFSLVTSGRRINANHIQRFCSLYRKIRESSPIYLCASMGLLNREELQALKDAGVQRYHCNLETAASYFGSLCTTHSHADKLRTIELAREVGMEICSGGIIGMGETLRQRLELATEAREAGATSMPVNILNPIKGTPLADTPLIEEEEIVRSVALMRLVAPKVAIRFAGGRARLSQKSVERMLRGGASGALVGDMLTTVGNKIDEDFKMFSEVRQAPQEPR